MMIGAERLERAERVIKEHPLVAVGGALALGVFAGFLASGKNRGRVSGAVSGALSGLLVAMMREAVLGKLGGYAKGWIDKSDREVATSFEPEVETFLEH